MTTLEHFEECTGQSHTHVVQISVVMELSQPVLISEDESQVNFLLHLYMKRLETFVFHLVKTSSTEKKEEK